MDEYLLFEEVRQEILKRYRDTGKQTGFREAALDMKRRGDVHKDEMTVPDFLKWDIGNLQELKDIAGKIPIPLDRITSVIPSYKNEEGEVLLPGTVPVQISLECACAPEIFTSLQEYFAILYVLDGKCSLNVKKEVYHLKGETVRKLE